MADVAMLGAGAFGTALAIHLARTGHQVVLCTRRSAHLEQMRTAGENAAYLPGVALPPTLELTDQWAEVVSGAKTLVMAVPSRFARATFAPIAHQIPPEATLISVTKGIEEDSLMTMSADARRTRAASRDDRGAFRTGFRRGAGAGNARGAGRGGAHRAGARAVQELFAARTLRIYRSMDVIGVELAGTVKNVIAIAAGISDGLDLGSSARAALITRGLAEMTRLVPRRTPARRWRVCRAGRSGSDLHRRSVAQPRPRSRTRAGEKPPAQAGEGTPVAEGMANAQARAAGHGTGSRCRS